MDYVRAFPRRVVIENTTACNARCVFCPREQLTRSIETMPVERYRALLDACVAAGARKLSLHNFGEPLLDANLTEKVYYAKRRGMRETFIVTNASLLTPERSAELIVAGLDRIKISMQGITKDEYEANHVHLHYETTVRNIEQLVAAKQQLGIRTPDITIRYMGNPRAFLAFWWRWRRLQPYLRIIPGQFHNYSNGRDYRPVAGDRTLHALKSCRYAGRSVLYILANGDVVPCCYDFNGVLTMGNAFEQPITAIWNGEPFQAFRRAHQHRAFDAYPLCAACDKLNYLFS